MEEKPANRPGAGQGETTPVSRSFAQRVAERVDKKCGGGYVPPSEMTLADLSGVATHLYRIFPAKTRPIKDLESFLDVTGTHPRRRRPPHCQWDVGLMQHPLE